MELQTIIQVSEQYSISSRMLRYYEEIGLLSSQRKEDYAYRVYDEENIKRLQQIIILRKLQIPVKQIRTILDKPDAAAAIELFKGNISDLENEISALTTIKSALEIFVSKIEEIAALQLDLQLLTDESVLELVDSLVMVQRNVRENKVMLELNQANEYLSDKNIKIVYRPPSKIAHFYYKGDVIEGDGKHRKIIEKRVKKFIEDIDLFKQKPDMRVFVYGNESDQGNIIVTLPDNFTLPVNIEALADMSIKKYPGGLYATSPNNDDMGRWVEDSEVYEWNPFNERAIGWEYFNPFNIYELDDKSYEENPFMYTIELFPIRKIEKISDKEKTSVNALIDKIKSQNSSVAIDFTKMAPFNRGNKTFEVEYPDGNISLKVEDGYNNGYLLSSEQIKLPLLLQLRAKSDKGGLRFGSSALTVQMSCVDSNWDKISLIDDYLGEHTISKKSRLLPVDEFVDIECLMSEKGIAVRINGELWHYGKDYKYVKEFESNKDYVRTGIVFFGTSGGCTITVESMSVIEYKSDYMELS